MSKKARRTAVAYKQPDTKQAEPEPVSLPPLKPRPRLFYALAAALGVWVAALLVLYATTVYPNRSSGSLAQPNDDAASEDTPQETVSR